MTLKHVLLVLCFDIIHETRCEDQQNTTDLDYYEFRMQHGDVLNYEDLRKRVLQKNKTKSDEIYGTDWQDFTDQTNILLDLPEEHEVNASTGRPASVNFWNIIQGAKFLTFLPNNMTTTEQSNTKKFTLRDLTDFTFVNWTFASEKLFFEQRDLTRNTKGEYSTSQIMDYMEHTDNDIFIHANDSWVHQFANKTSSEERKIDIEDFMKYTVTTGPPPSTTWNPFLIQSEERRELDRIAKEKRMATNNAVREAVKSGQFGGLGGLFGNLGGVIPVNLGGLGGLMGGLRTITIVMGGGGITKSTTKGITTSPRSTISRKTFKPRPDPKDFMSWKFLEDGSPRPPMPEDEFVRILKKHGTPPPYYIPPISIPAHLGEDVLENLMPDENTTIPFTIEPDQLDRIHNFINPFIQQHTAMDLLNVNNVGRFTTPPPTPRARKTTNEGTTTTTTTTRRTARTGIFTTQPPHSRVTDAWKAGWSRTGITVDPFDDDNLRRALNEGVQGDHPWKRETLKHSSTIEPHKDPRVAALEKDFDPVFFKDGQKKRQEQAALAKEEVERRRQKYKEKGITKPSYWKEVIFKRPVEPLFDETSTAPKTAELKNLFSVLSQGLTSLATLFTTKTTHPSISQLVVSSTATPRYSMYWTLDEQVSTVSNQFHRWTTPREDKERLQTLLSFMFPYIQKKSDIFGTEKDDAKASSTPTTEFDPWEDSDPGTPAIPELGKLFRILNVNTTERLR